VLTPRFFSAYPDGDRTKSELLLVSLRRSWQIRL
jgi:hypothetical protein